MGKIKIYLIKIKEIFNRYPRLLISYGFLIGIIVTCYISSNFKLNDISYTKSLSNTYILKDDKIDSIEKIEDTINYVVDSTYNDSESGVIVSDNKTVNSIEKENNNEILTSNINNTNPNEYITEFFNNTYIMIDSADKNDESFIDKIKVRLNSLYEFLFNDVEIDGYTYNDLTDDVKLRINKLMLEIDNKIDENFPNYKNEIKSSFSKLKAKTTIKYLETVDKVCNNDREYLCGEAKKDFNKMKESFKLSFSLIKDIIVAGKNNLIEYFDNK